MPPIAPYQPRIGTSFDYALRFGLAARGLGSQRDNTVAEGAVLRYGLEESIARRAKDAVGVLRSLRPTPDLPAPAARACVVLAGFDVLFRAGRPDEIEREPTGDEVDDVRALFAAVPWGTFTSARRSYLNPTFGQGSVDVGGADADIILDGLLLDIKTTKKIKLGVEYLRQIACYAIMANEHGINGDPTSRGSVDEVGIYFSRAGRVFRIPLDQVIAKTHHKAVRTELVTTWARIGSGRRR